MPYSVAELRGQQTVIEPAQLLCSRTALIKLQAPTPGTRLSPTSNVIHETAGVQVALALLNARVSCSLPPPASSACGQPGSAAGPWSSSRSRSPMNASPGHPQMSTACDSRACQHVAPGMYC
jgi:hypothetical protein